MLRFQLCSYVIFTAVVVLSERVEATVQKGFFRFMGTVIGGGRLLSCAPTAALTLPCASASCQLLVLPPTSWCHGTHHGVASCVPKRLKPTADGVRSGDG
jgi:Aluminium activated malate transporter